MSPSHQQGAAHHQTQGGVDNIFNKNAIHYTLFQKVLPNISYSKWAVEINKSKISEKRTPKSEYHYIVYNKNTKISLFKSILDIGEYKSNPSNILQVNWTQEFNNHSFKINNKDHINKKILLLKTVQKSIKDAIYQMSSMISLTSLKID